MPQKDMFIEATLSIHEVEIPVKFRFPNEFTSKMIRKYQTGDELAIGRIFYDPVHQLTCVDYNEEQRRA